MKLEYYKQTDTLYIEFKVGTAKTQKEISKDMVLDLDKNGSGLLHVQWTQIQAIRFSYCILKLTGLVKPKVE